MVQDKTPKGKLVSKREILFLEGKVHNKTTVLIIFPSRKLNLHYYMKPQLLCLIDTLEIVSNSTCTDKI